MNSSEYQNAVSYLMPSPTPSNGRTTDPQGRSSEIAVARAEISTANREERHQDYEERQQVAVPQRTFQNKEVGLDEVPVKNRLLKHKKIKVRQ